MATRRDSGDPSPSIPDELRWWSIWLADGEPVGLLLRELFAAAGGRHADWDGYDPAMAEQPRVIVAIEPTRSTATAWPPL